MNSYYFNREEQHFSKKSKETSFPEHPLTVTLQITRRCNLKCIYCSESDFIPDLGLKEIKKMLENLKGVNRIIVAGGEPSSRNDLINILKLCKQNKFEIIALASNGVNINYNYAKKLAKYVDYIDITIDGPRHIHNKIRGEYDQIINGIMNIKKNRIEFSIVTVLLSKNKEYLQYIAQIVDCLGAKKWKILNPISKGRGKEIIHKRTISKEIQSLFEKLKRLKTELGWQTRIIMTDWEQIKEGHALLIHPNGDVVASPVWSKTSCIELIGNIKKENIQEIWKRYPYKRNHLNKYIEKSLLVC